MLPIARTCCRRLPVSVARPSSAPAQRRGLSGGSSSSKKQDHAVIFSGIQPTGIPHLGNYFGAMRPWRQLQDAAGENDKLIFCIADLHAITVPQEPEGLRHRRREMLAALLAIGLDPERSTLFYQSSLPQHAELMWILSCTASIGYLGRMTQFKTKLQAENPREQIHVAMETRLKLGLFSYPVLQAADILVHRATHVPVGDDQKQHLEFTRECVTNFGHAYGKNMLVMPETLTTPSPRVMSLRDPLQKMSKSSPNEKSRILLTATAREIEQRIAGAVTDNINAVTYDPVVRPGVANLLEIATQCGGDGPGATATATTPAALADAMHGATLGDLKAHVARAVVRELAGVRERYQELLARRGGKYLTEVEAAGADVAARNAEETMRFVRDAVGLGRQRR